VIAVNIAQPVRGRWRAAPRAMASVRVTLQGHGPGRLSVVCASLRS
jgi:hypothetical protein